MLSRNLSSVKLVVGLVGACFKKLEYANHQEGYERKETLFPFAYSSWRIASSNFFFLEEFICGIIEMGVSVFLLLRFPP